MSSQFSRLFAVLLSGLLPVQVWGQSDEATQVDLLILSPPHPVKTEPPYYPQRPLQRSEEGTVDVHFMVDTDGVPFEAIVANSTGDRAFHAAALAALRRFRFDPAIYQGEPVIGSSIYRFTFNLDLDEPGATPVFVDLFRDFNQAMETDNREQIEAALAKLEERGSRNHYETARLSLARFGYESRYGDRRQQMAHLHAALSNSEKEDDIVYLEPDHVFELRRRLFTLQVLNNHLEEALRTYALLQATSDGPLAGEEQSMYQQLLALRDSDRAYGVPLTLDVAGSTSLHLFKRRLYITEVSGRVDEFKIYCSTRYFSLVPEVDVSYDIPGEWGGCTLFMLGDAGTEVMLVQH